MAKHPFLFQPCFVMKIRGKYIKRQILIVRKVLIMRISPYCEKFLMNEEILKGKALY